MHSVALDVASVAAPINCCFSHILHPLSCVFIVTNHSTHKKPVPTIRQAPLHTCTPTKSRCPSEFVFRSAPAIGAPMRVAMDETLHDMPSRVPSRERSGVMFANAAEGRVTRAAEKKPTTISNHTHASSALVVWRMTYPTIY